MKKLFFITLVLSCLFTFGKCNKKKKCSKKKANTEASAKLSSSEVWMQYDEKKCENPLQFNWFQKPTQEQILGAIKGNLLGKEIAILEIKSSTEKDFISCEACTCPNGTHYFVRVNKSEIEKLKALKFYEIKNIPKDVVIDNTK